jgi:hypothetical protein
MEDLNVTRDVITDLLPIYESGEASRDTQQLVQRFLDRDPEFSHWISRLKQTRLNGKEALPAPEVELKSLMRTKTLMKQQTAVWAVAIFFTLAPFIFIFEGNRITWWLPVHRCSPVDRLFGYAAQVESALRPLNCGVLP